MESAVAIHFTCPCCEEGSMVGPATAPDGAPPDGAPPDWGLGCPRCRFRFPPAGGRPDPARPVSRCAVCGGTEFYAQKDFNRALGLGIVITSAVAAFLVMVLAGHLWGLLVLGVVTLADAVIYRFLAEVSVCYLCQTVYRGYPPNPEHRGFYLGNEERFKALRRSWLSGLGL